jgi:hypothetical protein
MDEAMVFCAFNSPCEFPAGAGLATAFVSPALHIITLRRGASVTSA